MLGIINSLIITSCNQENEKKLKEEGVFYIDFESVLLCNTKCNNVETVLRHKSAKSGEFVSITNAKHPYSFLIKSNLSNLSRKQIKTLKFSAYFKTDAVSPTGDFIISIDSAGVQKFWSTMELKRVFKGQTDWVLIEKEVSLSFPLNMPDYTLTAYFNNTCECEILFDDFSIKVVN